MKTVEEKILITAIRMKWFILLLVVAMIISGIALCFIGLSAPSTFQFLGLKLSSGNVGLFVIAMGLLMFYLQKKMLEDIINPQSIKSIGSHISKARQTLSVVEKNPSTATSVEPINDFTTNSNNTVTRLDVIKILIQIVVSLMILIIAVFMIFSPNGDGITKFWVALCGVVVGYWLK